MSTNSHPVFEGSKFNRNEFAETMATFYFGPSRPEDPLGRYIDRAYRDLSRTLRLAALNQGARTALRADATSVMRAALIELAQGAVEPVTEEFDAWHKATCDALKSTYARKGVAFTYGQAQKWVNMALKYVFVALALDVAAPSEFRRYYLSAHMPVDSIVLAALQQRDYAGPLLDSAWSRNDDYEEYFAFQKSIREHFGCGLDAELMLWYPAQEEWSESGSDGAVAAAANE